MKVFFLFLGVLILLTACTQEQTLEETATSCPPVCSGGSTGVVSTIDSPRDGSNAYTGDRLVVSVGLYDEGESSVEDGTVCLTGLDSALFSGLGGCSCKNFYITIDDPKDNNFEKTRVEFPSSYVSTDASGDQHLSVYSRYSYTSYAPFTACLTGDPYEDTTCSTVGDILGSSSSGPVQVDSITEELTSVGGNAVTLRLHISASLSAAANEKLIPLEDTSSNECVLPREQGVDYTQASISAILFGVAHDCGKITFTDGEDTAEASCKIENIDTQLLIGNQKEYDGWVRLDYGFQNIQSVTFSVVSGQS